ncbi:MAG: decarboxylating NADP(+)-dependent phosphogluconate dehydrogenase [Promethearchaeota archaeon]
MEKADIGLIGLAVMGENLALNIERNGYHVAVYNRTTLKVTKFLKDRGAGKNIKGCYAIEELCNSLKLPRKILLVIQAGSAVNSMITQLLPFLDQSDIIIDGGNSFFKDTIRRSKTLKEKGFRFLGVGISGGEEGALKGPSIMSGGSYGAWEEVKEIFKVICAKIDGQPCCAYLGSDGAGHYVKMVHNGIEYSDMQLIAESYHLLKDILKLDAKQLEEVFNQWNKGELNSYLIEITKNIFSVKDPETNKPLVEMILDVAHQKGTGRWTSQNALEIGVSIPSITTAVFARFMSARLKERLEASKTLEGPLIDYRGNKEELIRSIREALYSSKICSYAQGFALLNAAQNEYGWELNLSEIASIWRNGCIIRASFLEKIKEAFEHSPNLKNLLLDSYFKQVIEKYQESWRNVIKIAVENGIPIPGFTSALAYYDSYRAPRLPANLIQAQRDYFGAHSFERIDKARGKFYHYDQWSETYQS